MVDERRVAECWFKREGVGFRKFLKKDKIEDMIYKKNKYDIKRCDLKLKRYERYLKKINLDFEKDNVEIWKRYWWVEKILEGKEIDLFWKIWKRVGLDWKRICVYGLRYIFMFQFMISCINMLKISNVS